jgi:predicted nuclease of predicted toxin-antitoxin system
MLQLLIDHDLDQNILRGLLQRIAGLDAVTAYEAGLREAPDPELLIWAAKEKRVLVTHDRRTMPGHAADLLTAGETIAGVIVISRRLPIRQVLDELEMIVLCSEANEWVNIIQYLPL